MFVSFSVVVVVNIVLPSSFTFPHDLYWPIKFQVSRSSYKFFLNLFIEAPNKLFYIHIEIVRSLGRAVKLNLWTNEGSIESQKPVSLDTDVIWQVRYLYYILPSSCLTANLLLEDTTWISYISHIFLLRWLRSLQPIPISKPKDDVIDMSFRNSWAARNPNEGFCKVLLSIIKWVILRLRRRKSKFSCNGLIHPNI